MREFLPLVLMWWAMMTAMMLPVTLPWFRTLRRLGGDAGSGPLVQFGLGYFGVWLGFSVGAAGLQRGLSSHAMMSSGSVVPWMGGLFLLLAGGYQFSRLKTSCLKHCRSPMSFFLSRWSNGPQGTLRLGFEHGVFCLGCCWALMLLGFAGGVMNVWWMAVLTAVVAVENFHRDGVRITRILGISFIMLGCYLGLQPLKG